ncbi:MAG: dipeptidase [Bacteroidota bacterium]
MNQIKQYINQHASRFEKELFAWLEIPSISTLKIYKPHIKASAELLKKYLLQAGIASVKLLETEGNPLVYGEKIVDEKLPTILIYGHYDVQPVDPLALWTNPPFSPTIRDGKIYARGVADDKGQVFAHVKALEIMHQLGNLPCNIKLLIEGEEEVGSGGLQRFLDKKENLQLIQADCVVVSDTSIQAMDKPSIPIALRGITALTIKIQSAKKDLHSGVYGGAVANPIQVLCTLLAALKNKEGQVAIPGFYDDVVALSTAERNAMNSGFSLEKYKEELGIADVDGEKDYTTLERVGIRPALDINGMWGGYIEEGVKTVLPAEAHANISIRLVANQDPLKVAQACKAYLISKAPKSVRIEVDIHQGGSKAFKTSTRTPGLKAARKAFKQVWGKDPVWMYEGGSIPILSKMQDKMGVDVVLLGFGLDSDNIHSPNEHFGIKNLHLGIETIINFYQTFAKTK